MKHQLTNVQIQALALLRENGPWQHPGGTWTALGGPHKLGYELSQVARKGYASVETADGVITYTALDTPVEPVAAAPKAKKGKKAKLTEGEATALAEADTVLQSEGRRTLRLRATAFVNDHISRDLLRADAVVRTGTRWVEVEVTEAEIAELLSDARHYADPSTDLDPSQSGLKASARALIKALTAGSEEVAA